MGSEETESSLSHLDQQGAARMVDVGDKAITARRAVATATVRMRPETMQLLISSQVPKGDVLATARIAAIQAAKRTPFLLPLCHHVALSGCEVSFTPDVVASLLHIEACVRAQDRTGVEMEALTAVGVAGLTVYDMLKAVDREMVISDIRLLEKSGGRSGTFSHR